MFPLGGARRILRARIRAGARSAARARPLLDGNQQVAPWSWFIERYRQWSEHERLQREGQRWTHGIDGIRWRRFDIVPIRDSATLWKEGEQMRTCLSRYAAACAAGAYVIYSVRAGNRERPVAHIGLRIEEEGWATFDQVRGFANAEVERAPVIQARHQPRRSFDTSEGNVERPH